jgi:hypothetical protein
MTAQERIANATLSQSERVGGVWVTILPRNITCLAQIDRINKPFGKVESEIVMQGENGLTVYIVKARLNTAPAVGELIQESNGDQHVIGQVKDLGQRWQIFCESSPS